MKFDNLSGAILTFVLVGMLLGIGLVILNTLQNNTTKTITGQTATVVWNAPDTAYTITELVSVTSIANSTGTTIGSGNYTVTAAPKTRAATGTVTVVNNVTGIGGCTHGGNCTITYVRYNYADAAPTAMNAVETAVSEIPNNWLLIIMVVVAASIVIGLISKSFTNGR